jgi:hypothetical protein
MAITLTAKEATDSMQNCTTSVMTTLLSMA